MDVKALNLDPISIPDFGLGGFLGFTIPFIEDEDFEESFMIMEDLDKSTKEA